MGVRQGSGVKSILSPDNSNYDDVPMLSQKGSDAKKKLPMGSKGFKKRRSRINMKPGEDLLEFAALSPQIALGLLSRDSLSQRSDSNNHLTPSGTTPSPSPSPDNFIGTVTPTSAFPPPHTTRERSSGRSNM